MKTLLLTLCVMLASAVSAADMPLKGKRVVVFKGYGKGFVHKNIEVSAQMMVDMGRAEGFAVDTTSSMSLFCDERLDQYDAIVYANASYLDYDDAQKAALQRFIRRGGAFVGLHAATTTGDRWPWFTRMIGGCFDYHPALQQITVDVVEPSHPSVKGLPERFSATDELYIFKSFNPDVRVLARSSFEGIEWGKRVRPADGDATPAIWCHEFEGGRVWYTALGHNNDDYHKPQYIAHVLAGLRWALDK